MFKQKCCKNVHVVRSSFRQPWQNGWYKKTHLKQLKQGKTYLDLSSHTSSSSTRPLSAFPLQLKFYTTLTCLSTPAQVLHYLDLSFHTSSSSTLTWPVFPHQLKFYTTLTCLSTPAQALHYLDLSSHSSSSSTLPWPVFPHQLKL